MPISDSMALSHPFDCGGQSADWKPSGGKLKPITHTPEITLEKSEEAAMQIGLLNSFAFALDEEYLAEAARQTRQQASHYDATAALNQMWLREQSMLLDEQANALEQLASYIKSNKRIRELREELERAKKNISRFNNF